MNLSNLSLGAKLAVGVGFSLLFVTGDLVAGGWLSKSITSQVEILAAASKTATGAEYATGSTQASFGLFVGIGVSSVVSFILAWFLASRRTVGRLRNIRSAVDKVAEGDLTRRIQLKGNDEIAELGAAIDRANGRFLESFRQVQQNAHTLVAASENLSEISNEFKQNSAQTTKEVESATNSAKEVEQSINVVATSVEEMNASINEISKNTVEASGVASEAEDLANKANNTMANLGESSDGIGNVINVITSIAEQTKMLALNASIEAERAGEAGMGFAVVAKEVKVLAKQTADATDEICEKISSIQGETQSAINDIREIGAIIKKINSSQGIVASSIEEQTVTTSEISRYSTDAAKESQSITQGVVRMRATSMDASLGAGEVENSSKRLAKLSDQLQEALRGFDLGREEHSLPKPQKRKSKQGTAHSATQQPAPVSKAASNGNSVEPQIVVQREDAGGLLAEAAREQSNFTQSAEPSRSSGNTGAAEPAPEQDGEFASGFYVKK